MHPAWLDSSFQKTICNQYAAQTNVFPEPSLADRKKPDFVWPFLICKKSQNFKIWLQKTKLATLSHTTRSFRFRQD